MSIALVANLNRRVKRADLFLEAASRIAATHPEVTWHLVGDGELRAEYEQLAERLGVSNRTVFSGRVVDVPKYLERINIGVICSDSEGFSNAILEYMLNGCTVVATNVGGNPEVVRHGETGVLVEPRDAAALASAITALVEDPAERLRLACSAHETVVRDFSWPRCVEQHESMYMSMFLDGRDD